MHAAAREMVYVAEQGLLADRNNMDPTWQEMLNHATGKVTAHVSVDVAMGVTMGASATTSDVTWALAAFVPFLVVS